MALRYALIDDSTHGLKRGPPATAGGATFDNQKFTVAGASQTQFQCSTITFEADTLMVVLINGVEYEEGASLDWTRDVNNQRININWAVQNGSRVTVRVF